MATQHQKKRSWLHRLTSLLQTRKTYFKKTLPKVGLHHNLKEIFDEINTLYFSKDLDLNLEWSGSGITRSQTVIRLGYYNPRSKLIKINRILDAPHVPSYFISFVIYHEMLHHVFPPVKSGARRKIHHVKFKQKEKDFQEYELAQAFLKDLKKTLFAPNTHKKTLSRNLP